MIPVMGVPTLTRFDLCQRMLDSIDYPVENLIVVDNSGKREFVPIVPDFVQNVWLMQMPTNLGVAGSWNMIIKSFPYADRWLVASDDIVFAPGVLAAYDELSSPDEMQFFDADPKWACFSVGEKVVQEAGLACELFHPAYFEDNDWERRIESAGVKSRILPLELRHDNSSTLNSGFQARNSETFTVNHGTYVQRLVAETMTGGEWDLNLRRRNRWD